MKKITTNTLVLAFIVIGSLVFFSSCSRYVTVDQAANGKARCGKWLR